MCSSDLYVLYNDFVDEMHRYALNHSLDDLLKSEMFPSSIHVEKVEDETPKE